MSPQTSPSVYSVETSYYNQLLAEAFQAIENLANGLSLTVVGALGFHDITE